MQIREYTARFVTPAFLGNAEQNGQWRTPPFKHLLREWWRVAWAEAHGFSSDHRAMREEEGKLFGAAADAVGTRSKVRVRLDSWKEGNLKRQQWQALPKVNHKEVKFPIDAGLYLGYGPVTLPRGAKVATLKANAAIQVGEHAKLRLAFPEQDAQLLDRALGLMNRFGTIGGRSRNGWGSFLLEGAPEPESLPLHDWRDALDIDWPHAIGRDEEGALIWRTEGFDDWRQLMRRLAEIKIGLRTQFVFPNEKPPHRQVEDRHWLAYPVTKHSTKAWPRNARLPNSLRFKVVEGENSEPYGLIFHVPCKPAPQFRPDIRAIESVWHKVHGFLDQRSDLKRSGK